MTVLHESDTIMRAHANYSWAEWFASGDPFAPYDDGEASKVEFYRRRACSTTITRGSSFRVVAQPHNS
jgi:hypothetical protein